MSFEKIVECVPNFSEGRNGKVIEKIADAFRVDGVKLLDYSADVDHNRSVFTVVGEPTELAEAVINAVGVAKDNIDLTKQSGEHPRIGAADVVPFVPIKNVSVEETVELSKFVGQQIATRHGVPVYLYEKSATAANRGNLADIRKGQFEGLSEKMKAEEWKPDFGNPEPHPTAGATVVGCRPFLVAFNVNLDTPDVEIATKIARRVRFINGGLRFVKALGVKLNSRNVAQVTMNLTDYTKTPVYAAFETVRMEARRYGVNVIGTEIIGLIPQQALLDCVEYYLQIENFSSDKVLENNL
ncbi:MAG: glutamate formimidoyltransferase [Clostridiales bacterium]|nr:glutamate formimidoyltransferase [Clostridiales bacterium]MDY5726641.1 glutamate formimidoyltransferase [Eubacteriales bacterium]